MNHLIKRLDRGGDGVAAGSLRVPLALPGEIVAGEVRSGLIAAPTVVSPSPARVRPPCRHFGACGGCALQHASDSFVKDWKQRIVRDALAEYGLSAPIGRVHTSPPASRRRAVFSGRRMKNRAVVGFHAPASDTIVGIPDCILLAPALTALLPALERIVMVGGSRRGELRMSVNSSETGADIRADGGKPVNSGLVEKLARIVSDHAISRLTWNGDLVAQVDQPYQNLGGVRVVPPPGSFLQPTKEGELAMIGAVTRAVGQAGLVADLFAGCGTLTLPLARMARIHSVDADAGMLRSLESACRGVSGLKTVTTETRDIHRHPLAPRELAAFDALVADPPRAGAGAQAAAIGNSDLARVAMVSCNPVSFARDARIMADAGFGIEWIEIIDQFRWSVHVELVARLSRE